MTLTETAQRRHPFAPFAALVTAEGAAGVVSVRGEVDVFTLPALTAAVARAISEHDGPVIVDLGDSSFIDIGTLRALGRAAQFLEDRGRALTVRAPAPMAVRLLAFVGLARLIDPDEPSTAPPYDAFWGVRYAMVTDPDGNAVGIMSPVDEGLRSPPPAPA